MSNERILAQLQKNLQSYRDRKESLEHRLTHIEEQLKSATKLVAETEEAIAALEGRTTETRRMLEEALKQTQPLALPEAPILHNHLGGHNISGCPACDRASSAKNSNQPPAEPGFKWENGNLVPISIPTGEDVGTPIPLPPIDDNFEPIDPMSFNPLI